MRSPLNIIFTSKTLISKSEVSIFTEYYFCC